MLQLLHIENIAVIERADISFRAGFNALTGETGAGKSIVIDSLGAVLGARTSRDLIRTGAAKAFVSAEFDGVDASLPVLAALGVEPEDGVLLLQRDIYADGKNICRANGRPITVAQLRALGTSLLNIHGQHEGTQLLDEEQHGAYLDRFARLDGLPEAYTARYQAVRETQRQIEALEMDEAEKARRVDTLRHQIAELERAEPVDQLARGGLFLDAVDRAQPIEGLHRLCEQRFVELVKVDADDLLHLLLRGEGDVVEDAAAQEGVGQLLFRVGRDDDDGALLCLDRFLRLGNVELHLVQLPKEVVGELKIGLVHLVDEQHHLLVGGECLAELAELDILCDIVHAGCAELAVV